MKKFSWLLLLLAAALLSVSFGDHQGAADLSFETIWNAIFAFDYENQLHQVLRNIRLPVCWLLSSRKLFLLLRELSCRELRKRSGRWRSLGVNSGAAMGLAIAFILFLVFNRVKRRYFRFGAFAATALLFIDSLCQVGMSPTGLIFGWCGTKFFFSTISQTPVTAI